MSVLMAVLADLELGDLALGDPPNRWHPTAWMGTAIDRLGRCRPRRGAAADLAAGTAVVAGGGLAAAGAGFLVTRVSRRLPRPFGAMVIAAVLGTTFSIRGLDRAALEVQRALEVGDLAAARRLLAWHLVSRDTGSLSPGQVAAATIESVAGKAAARLDDVINLVPARLTGLLLVATAALAGASPRGVWSVMRRDARRTASPNAGVPMGAMAGALSVALEKPGCYVLGEGFSEPDATDVRRARRLVRFAVGLGVGGAVTLSMGRSR